MQYVLPIKVVAIDYFQFLFKIISNIQCFQDLTNLRNKKIETSSSVEDPENPLNNRMNEPIVIGIGRGQENVPRAVRREAAARAEDDRVLSRVSSLTGYAADFPGRSVEIPAETPATTLRSIGGSGGFTCSCIRRAAASPTTRKTNVAGAQEFCRARDRNARHSDTLRAARARTEIHRPSPAEKILRVVKRTAGTSIRAAIGRQNERAGNGRLNLEENSTCAALFASRPAVQPGFLPLRSS